MYYVMKCLGGLSGEEPTQLSYEPDDPFRLWDTGTKFSTDEDEEPHEQEPPVPVEFETKNSGGTDLKEMWEFPACVMTKRLSAALREAGVANIDE